MIKVKCIRDFKRVNKCSTLNFYKGEIYKVELIDGKYFLNFDGFPIPYKATKKYFEEVL